MTTQASSGTFYGWRVVGAAFVLGAFGWGVGFFGPPVYLTVVQQTRGWPLVLVSTAVSFHFLVGAVTGARLSALYSFRNLMNLRACVSWLIPTFDSNNKNKSKYLIAYH